MKKLLFSLLLFLNLEAHAQQKVDPDTWEYRPGFIDFYWDASSGKIYLHLKSENLDSEFLYANGLSAGLGSNDIGLDRGQLGDEFVVTFNKIGDKIFLKAKNLSYRALSPNKLEQRAVEEAFAQSVLWGFPIVDTHDDGYFIDVTPFIVRDAHGVARRLELRKQGTYRLDLSRSAIHLERTKNFPQNTEFDAMITLTGDVKGEILPTVVPHPEAVTVHQHHSFIQLPDDDYRPRVFDVRSGYFSMSYFDYSTPIDRPINQRYIVRHRLEKKNPDLAKSEPVEPIIYYVDAGTPEPIRSALIGGASWWNQAFEAAGYINAFQVREMPADADPMDVRYNVIQWVHRSTRGWSYGSSITDPRTGEILKGHVSLGSLRVRQDYLIAQGLDAAFQEGKSNQVLIDMALARLRQLSAHEVGHTLGLAHNFAASTNDRASVMDYPHPHVEINSSGEIDFSKAYDDKIGAWDIRTILYGYQDFPAGTDEHKALENILLENERSGLTYISDQDARPIAGAHPTGHLWDGGQSPIVELKRLLELRERALSGFGRNHIPAGTPMADLERVLVPLYLSHRYQAEATLKLIGGVDYGYTVKGQLNEQTKMVSPSAQKEALNILLQTLTPEVLTLPESIIQLIPPVPVEYERDRELFQVRTGMTFDPVSIAEAYVTFILAGILNPQRMSRILEQHARNDQMMSVQKYLSTISSFLREQVKENQGLNRLIAEAAEKQFVHQLITLAADRSGHHSVHGLALLSLNQYAPSDNGDTDGHTSYLNAIIDEFRKNPERFKTIEILRLPDGPPIGCEDHF